MTYETVGVSLSTSQGTVVAPDVVANNKGLWVELDASTAFAVEGFWVCFGNNSASPLDYLIDIGIGADGSEVILIPDLLYSTGDPHGELNYVYFPISIASGTRISARQQNTGGFGSIDISVILTTDSGLDVTAYTSVDTMGALPSSNSRGTQIDPGSTVNTKNSPYVEIESSTANAYKALIVIIGQDENPATTNAGFLFDVAIGASSSEVDFFSNFNFTAEQTGDTMQPKVFGPFACDIPSGSRLSVRAQCSINEATDRLFDIVLYGIY